MATLYEILGVSPTATAEQIETAYRRLVKQTHPDANPQDRDGALRRFQRVQSAYEKLSDPGERYQYNRLHGRDQNGWFPIPMDVDISAFCFHSDGDFSCGGMRFHHTSAVELTVNENEQSAFQISKAPGLGEELVIEHAGGTIRNRFHGDCWYANSPREESAEPPVDPAEGPTAASSEPTTTAVVPYALPRSSRIHRLLSSFPKTVLAVAALGIAIAIGWLVNSLQQPVPAAALPSIADREDELALRKQQAEIAEQEDLLFEAEQSRERQRAAAQANREQEAALTRGRLQQLLRKGEKLLLQHAELVSEKGAWDTLASDLLSNDAGRILATRDEWIRTFQATTQQPRPTDAELVALRREVEEVLTSVRRAAAEDSPADVSSADTAEFFAERDMEIGKHLADYRKARRLIEGLTATGPPNGEKTLGEAIQDIEIQDAKEQATLTERETSEVRRKLKEANAQAERRKVETELAELESAAQREKDAAAKKLKHEEDIREAKSQIVRDTLSFFTAKGYYQPSTIPNTHALEQHTEAKPISLTRLRTLGVHVKGDKTARQRLINLLKCNFDDQRGHWRILGDPTPQQQEQLSRIQDYIARLGPVLVELEMLSE